MLLMQPTKCVKIEEAFKHKESLFQTKHYLSRSVYTVCKFKQPRFVVHNERNGKQ